MQEAAVIPLSLSAIAGLWSQLHVPSPPVALSSWCRPRPCVWPVTAACRCLVASSGGGRTLCGRRDSRVTVRLLAAALPGTVVAGLFRVGETASPRGRRGPWGRGPDEWCNRGAGRLRGWLAPGAGARRSGGRCRLAQGEGPEGGPCREGSLLLQLVASAAGQAALGEAVSSGLTRAGAVSAARCRSPGGRHNRRRSCEGGRCRGRADGTLPPDSRSWRPRRRPSCVPRRPPWSRCRRRW